MNIQRVLKKINLHRLMQLAIVLLLATSLFSCSKDNDPEPEELEEEIGNLPGLGEKSGSPLGTQFTLPDGVTVDGEIRGGICNEAEIQIGSGLLVTVCIGLRNDNDDEKTITFPGGLILISTTDSYQNGIVVKDETIVIPPKTTIRFVFYTYCGNASRASANGSAVYTFGPVTNSKLIARLVGDLKNKKISAVDYLDGDDFSDDYYGVLTNVQSLLWFITDATGITDWNSFEMMYRQQMNQIPNK